MKYTAYQAIQDLVELRQATVEGEGYWEALFRIRPHPNFACPLCDFAKDPQSRVISEVDCKGCPFLVILGNLCFHYGRTSDPSNLVHPLEALGIALYLQYEWERRYVH